MAEKVEFKDLWYGHPINESVQTPCIAPRDGVYQGRPARKGFPTFANQCAIRMGTALRHAGVTADRNLTPGSAGRSSSSRATITTTSAER